MKKYLEILEISFKTQLVYRFDVVFQMLFSVIKIIFATVVWGAIYAERSEVAGFTLGAMLSYYVFNAFLSQLDLSDTVSYELMGQIRNGTFSKYMVVPVRVLGWFWAQLAGKAAFFFAFNLLAAVLWTILFRVDFIITANPLMIAGALLLAGLGLIFMLQLNFFLGILTFKFQDIWVFLMIKTNILALVTGSLVPLALLPQPVVAVLRLLPFYYGTYLPSMLLIGKNGGELLPGLLTLAAWVLVFIPVNAITYQRLRTRYVGVGI